MQRGAPSGGKGWLISVPNHDSLDGKQRATSLRSTLLGSWIKGPPRQPRFASNWHAQLAAPCLAPLQVRVSTLRLLASLPPAQRMRAARVRRTTALRKPR